MYVDNFISGAPTVADARTSRIFKEAQFVLHKWNSNVEELENHLKKQQPGTLACSLESKLLDLPWNKREDTLSVIFPSKSSDVTKRGMLSTLARGYDHDPLDLVSPIMLQGKLVYS
jgi:hypothetical protein